MREAREMSIGSTPSAKGSPTSTRRSLARLAGCLLGASAALAALAMALLPADPALAHKREVVKGYAIEVGFWEEPVIAMYPNALYLKVARADSGEPVTGAEGTLKVELTTMDGRERREVLLLPVPDRPGIYTSEPFIISQPKEYAWHIFGQIRGESVETVLHTDPVEDPSSLQFPSGGGPFGSEGPGLALPLSAVALALGLLGAGSGIYALLSRRRGA